MKPEDLPEHDLLVRTVWAEARNQSPLGQTAVAAVILNRATNPVIGWWGNTIKEVCLKPWQFSCWNEGDPNRSKALALVPESQQYKAIADVVRYALEGYDPTDGCDHYLVNSLRDKVFWAATNHPVCTIGDHTFYRLEQRSKIEQILERRAHS